jgi:hypothetical protein
MTKVTAIIISVFIQNFVLLGCASHELKTPPSLDECIQTLKIRVESLPTQSYIETLEGEKVLLREFFDVCLMYAPLCSLPDKFYHWVKEVRLVKSKTPRGPITHLIRIYHNYLSACQPDFVDPIKIHGDIAEFYDEMGEFMGLAVYAGKGVYFPLPYSRYNGFGNNIRFYLKIRPDPLRVFSRSGDSGQEALLGPDLQGLLTSASRRALQRWSYCDLK